MVANVTVTLTVQFKHTLMDTHSPTIQLYLPLTYKITVSNDKEAMRNAINLQLALGGLH